MHEGKRLSFAIGKVSADEAQAKLGQVDLFLMRLEQRLAVIPPGTTLVEYLKYDGRPMAAEAPQAKAVKLSALRDKYIEANAHALERTTLDCTRTHFRHLTGVLGEGFHVDKLKLSDLQRYVNVRSTHRGKNGRALSPTTIEKELQTFRTAWHWGTKDGLVAGAFPNDGNWYPRATEKPVFMTRKEIERHIKAGGLDAAQTADLWQSLYLTIPEITEFLSFVKKNALQPFLFCQDDMPRNGIHRKGQPQLNRGKAYDHFRRVLKNSKWDVVAGFHVLRHSFISALASRGVDQRLVEEFAGHQNAETSRRYRHLYPSTKREALTAVFG